MAVSGGGAVSLYSQIRANWFKYWLPMIPGPSTRTPTASGPTQYAGVEAGQGLGEMALGQVGALLAWLHLTGLPGLGPVLSLVLCAAGWWRLLGLLRLRGTPLLKDTRVLVAWWLALGLSGLEVGLGSIVAVGGGIGSLGVIQANLGPLVTAWFLGLWWTSVASAGLAASVARWLEIGWLRIELRVGQAMILVSPALLLPVAFGTTAQWALVLGGCGMGLSLVATIVLRDGMTRVGVALPQDSELQVPLVRGRLPEPEPSTVDEDEDGEVELDDRGRAPAVGTDDPISLEPTRGAPLPKSHLAPLPDQPAPPAERDRSQDDVGI